MVSLMTSSWWAAKALRESWPKLIECRYTKHEAPLRMAIWHGGYIASNIFSGLLAAGILTNMDNVAGLRAWQWFVFLEGKTISYSTGLPHTNDLTGLVSIIIGVASFWGIPNFPHNTGTYFLTPEESEMAQYRMMVLAGGRTEDDEGRAWEGVQLAVRDLFTWIFTVLHFGLILALPFKDFFPSVSPAIG